MGDHRFWLYDSDRVPPGAEDYDGPPPIPLDKLRHDLPPGWTAQRGWHLEPDEDGKTSVMPITIVHTTTGETLHYFPRRPRRMPGRPRS